MVIVCATTEHPTLSTMIMNVEILSTPNTLAAIIPRTQACMREATTSKDTTKDSLHLIRVNKRLTPPNIPTMALKNL